MPEFLTLQIPASAVIAILAVCGVAVVTDIRQRRILNVVTFPAMAIGLALNTAAYGFSGLAFAASGLLIGVLLFVVPVAFMGRGAGDLKLLAALGALGGPAFVFWTALWSGALGGVFAFVVLISQRRLGPVLAGFALDAQAGQFPVARSNIRLPYAVPIAAGAFIGLLFA
jgi:prepilin peptidase CpaA